MDDGRDLDVFWLSTSQIDPTLHRATLISYEIIMIIAAGMIARDMRNFWRKGSRRGVVVARRRSGLGKMPTFVPPFPSPLQPHRIGTSTVWSRDALVTVDNYGKFSLTGIKDMR
jgi:hypothetical protein